MSQLSLKSRCQTLPLATNTCSSSCGLSFFSCIFCCPHDNLLYTVTVRIQCSSSVVPGTAKNYRIASFERLERRKYLNRYVTQPEPFVFFTPSRSETRQPPMPKDPHSHISCQNVADMRRIQGRIGDTIGEQLAGRSPKAGKSLLRWC